MRNFKRSHVITAALILAVGLSVTVWLLVRPTYADELSRCEKAVAAYDFDANPVDEGDTIPGCEDVDRDDYLAFAMDKALDGMSKKDRDRLDYYDNGTIDGSIG